MLRTNRLSAVIRAAKDAVRAGNPIPTDIYAALDTAGIDITDLERNARNGK